MLTNFEKKKLKKQELNKINREEDKQKEQTNKENSKTKFKEKLNKQKSKGNKINIDESNTIIKLTPEYYNNSKFNLLVNKSTISNAGLGIFALDKIHAYKYIGNYEGKQITRNYTGPYYFELYKRFGIDARDYPRCYMAMINDSYKTDNKINCKFMVIDKKKVVEIWSITDIEIGDELFISYGEDYWIDYI